MGKKIGVGVETETTASTDVVARDQEGKVAVHHVGKFEVCRSPLRHLCPRQLAVH
jgi:hypothetical protein